MSELLLNLVSPGTRKANKRRRPSKLEYNNYIDYYIKWYDKKNDDILSRNRAKQLIKQLNLFDHTTNKGKDLDLQLPSYDSNDNLKYILQPYREKEKDYKIIDYITNENIENINNLIKQGVIKKEVINNIYDSIMNNSKSLDISKKDKIKLLNYIDDTQDKEQLSYIDNTQEQLSYIDDTQEISNIEDIIESIKENILNDEPIDINKKDEIKLIEYLDMDTENKQNDLPMNMIEDLDNYEKIKSIKVVRKRKNNNNTIIKNDIKQLKLIIKEQNKKLKQYKRKSLKNKILTKLSCFI